MRAAPAVVVAALLCAVACSSAGGGGPAYRLGALRALLVGTSDVQLSGYLATTPAGEQLADSTTAIRYFTTADGFRQVTVTLVATRDAAAARASSARAVRTALASLRSTSPSPPVAIGADTQHVVGRTKGYGALQDSVYFVQGAVAVSVTLSSSTPALPSGVAVAVARTQDARLRKAA